MTPQEREAIIRQQFDAACLRDFGRTFELEKRKTDYGAWEISVTAFSPVYNRKHTRSTLWTDPETPLLAQ